MTTKKPALKEPDFGKLRRPKADKGEFEGAQPLQCPCGAAAKQRGIKRSGVPSLARESRPEKAGSRAGLLTYIELF